MFSHEAWEKDAGWSEPLFSCEVWEKDAGSTEPSLCTLQHMCWPQLQAGGVRSLPGLQWKSLVCLGSGAAAPTAGGNEDSWKLPLLKSIGPSELGNSYTELALGTGLGAEGALQLIAAFPPLEETLFCRHCMLLASGSQAWKRSVSIWPLEQGSSYLVLKAKLFSCCI